MSLSMVLLSDEVWLTCAAHALTTKSEEIMGLLFGDVKDLEGKKKTALIWGASPQVRSVRLKDRVETSPELQIEATAHADRMAETLGIKTRVIGWYHSHPGHTIHPSHVDVQTQGQYQQMDSDFIGLIFSCFSEDAQKVQNMQVIAFQSLDGRQKRIPPVDNYSVVELDSSSSDNALSTSAHKFEHDTADSRASKGNQRMNGQPLGQHNVNTLHGTIPETDSDMSDSLQEALRRSRMDVSAAEYIKKEVRFQVLPSKDILRLGTPQDLPNRQKLATSKMRATPLACVADLQDVLFEEERLSFQSALEQNTRDGKIHPLTYIHHTSTYQASLCKLMEVCVSPMINALDDRLGDNISRSIKLAEETKSLELKIREKEASRRQKSRVFSGGGDVVMEQADIQAPIGSMDVRTPYGKEAGVSRHNMQIN